jgi:hypothetical protein
LHFQAVKADPEDKFVMDNYDAFLRERLPGGLYSGGGPGEVVRKRSSIVEENPHSSEKHEWALYIDPDARDVKFSRFWADSVTSQTQWEEPNWEKEWKKREKRSEETNHYGDWIEMSDSHFDALFYVNKKFNKYQWENPYEF